MTRPAPRSASRRVALQVLYALDLASRKGAAFPPQVADCFERVAENFELPPGACAFAQQLVAGVTQRRDELDALISEKASHWRIDRMAAVDRNVLRLAAWELCRTDTPTSVVIDEAIELAREFGGDPSPAFVNGVLDAVAKSIERPGNRVAGEESAP